MNRPSQRGFTLIEVVIAVAVVGILASFAYPSYTESVRKSRRSDAHVALMDTAQQLERCFTEYNRYDYYVSATDRCSVVSTGPAISFTSPEVYYTIANTALSSNAYTISATPVTGGLQASDSKCTAFTLSNTGAKGFTGGGSLADCW